MEYTVMVPSDIAAKNVDAWNRSVVNTEADIENGAVFACGALSTDKKQNDVFTMVTPTTGAGLKNLWMAYSPEVVVTQSGDFQVKGIDADPRHFVNVKGVPFDAYKIQVGDQITLTEAGISGTKGANTYVVAANGATKLAFASEAIEGVTYKILKETNIIIANGKISGNAVKAYLLECVAIA